MLDLIPTTKRIRRNNPRRSKIVQRRDDTRSIVVSWLLWRGRRPHLVGLDQEIAEVSPAERHLSIRFGIVHLLEEHEMGHCHAVDTFFDDVGPARFHDEVDVVHLEPLVAACFCLDTDV